MCQWIKYLLITLISVGLTILVLSKDGLYTRPESPPRLYYSLFDSGPPTKEQVEKYQNDLLTYIHYLEQHYVSVGLYYDAHKELPILQHRNDGCRIYDYTFKAIPLPDAPIDEDDVDVDIILSKLAEHVVQLRGRIKEQNAYMVELAKYYRPCYDPSYRSNE